MKIFLNIIFLTLTLSLTSCMGPVDGSSGECVKMEGIFQIPPESCVEGDVCKPTSLFIENADGDKVGITTFIVQTMTTIMSAASDNIFSTVATDTNWRNLVHTTMSVALSFYVIAAMFGIASTAPYNVIKKMIVFILIWSFATNMGFFNLIVRDFFEGLVQSFVFILNNMFSDTPSADSGAVITKMFEIIDNTMSMFVSFDFFKLLLAAVTTTSFGWLYALFFLWLSWNYMFALFEAVKIYILALIARFLLYALAPLFIVFALFDQTKSIFQGWLEQVINFTLQPIFVFAFISMYHQLINGFMGSIILDKTMAVCFRPFLEVGGGFFPILWFYRLGGGAAGQAVIQGSDADLPFNIWAIISMVFLAMLMKSMMRWSVEVAGRLSGGVATVGNLPVKGVDMLKQGAAAVPRAAGAYAVGFFGGNKVNNKHKGMALRAGGKARSDQSVDESKAKIFAIAKNNIFD